MATSISWDGLNLLNSAVVTKTPGYPLVIAEVDDGKLPSLKKNTVTVIDDRKLNEPEGIEFSNFTLIQNRETHALDLYMVVTGHSPTKNYKYVVTIIR